jgi:diamine N-acetyltransferase
MQVELREITFDTVRAICNLQVAPAQAGFVAPNAVSLAQALFSPEAWFRAIYADGEPAGFLMLFDETQSLNPPPAPGIGLWRLMIDQRFQGRGVGRLAMQQLAGLLRERGFKQLRTSYMPGDGCPEPFYRSLGFAANGEWDDDEIIMVLPL